VRPLCTIVGCVALLACAETSDPSQSAHRPGTRPSPPSLQVTLVGPERPEIRLARQLEVTSNRPVSLRVSLSTDGEPTRILDFGASSPQQTLPILALKADRQYRVVVTATDTDGRSSTQTRAIHTDALPLRWPRLETLVHRPDEMSPGYTLLDAKTTDPTARYILILDPDLEPVWYWEAERSLTDTRITEDGRLVVLESGDIRVTDLVGNSFGPWDTIGPVHHEAFPMPDDGLLTLATITATSPWMPVDYDHPEDLEPDVPILDTQVLRYDAQAKLLTSWPLHDILDTSRVGYDALNNATGGMDWVHANGVTHDPTDGGFLVSLRHQDCIIKLSPEGSLQWILGNHMGWSPAFSPALLQETGEPFLWPYHPHAPQVTDQGLVVLMDNGNHRETPYGPPGPPKEDWFSRAVAYRVDEAAMTVEQVWEVRDTSTGPVYSGALGDADVLANGNVLATFGWVTQDNGVDNVDLGRGRRSSRLIEARPDGEILLDLRLSSHYDNAPDGWKTYRAERVPELYPIETRPAIQTVPSVPARRMKPPLEDARR